MTRTHLKSREERMKFISHRRVEGYTPETFKCPKRDGYVYLVYFPDFDEYKIGKTTAKPEKRFRQLRWERGGDLEVKHYFFTDHVDAVESFFHILFMCSCINGTFEHPNNQSEYFDLLPEDVDYFIERSKVYEKEL